MQKILAIAGVVIKELYRRKDFYVLFVLTSVLTLILGSINFFDDSGVVRYLKEICLLLIWLSALVIAIITAARQIPVERERRTIFPLLAKPVTRWHLIAGKFLGCWLATGVALITFYAFFGIVAGAREHAWPLVSYFQALWLHWVMVGIIVSITLFGSVIFSAPSANSTIIFIFTIGVLFAGRHLHKVANGLPEPSSSLLSTVYFLIPHLEFFDLRDVIIHQWGTIAWTPMVLATLYGVAYMSAFLSATWLSFRRKSLN